MNRFEQIAFEEGVVNSIKRRKESLARYVARLDFTYRLCINMNNPGLAAIVLEVKKGVFSGFTI